VEAVYRKNENYKTANGQTVPFTQFQKTNVHSILKYQLNSKSNFKVDVLYDLAHNVGYPALPMDVSLARAGLVALEYNKKAKTEWKLKVYANSVLHIMDDSQRDSLYLLKENANNKSDSVYMRMDMPGKSSTIGAYAEVKIPQGNRNYLIVKLDNYTNSSLAEMTMYMHYAGFAPEVPMYMQTWPAMLRTVSGLYISQNLWLGNNLKLNLNGRMDYNLDILKSDYGQEEFSIFNYNVAEKKGRLTKSFNLDAEYSVTDYFTLNASSGYAERNPTLSERLGFYLYNAYDGYDYIGNPDINSERSNFYRFKLQFSNTWLNINLGQSFSFVHDYILGRNDSTITPMNFYARGIRVYSNISLAQLYSTDLQFLLHPQEQLSLFWTLKYTYGEFKSGEPMPFISPLRNVVSLRWQANKLVFQLEMESAMQQTRINTDYNEQVTPAFEVFNLKSSYQYQIKSYTIDMSVGVSNLFNKLYYEHLDWSRIYRPGRSFDFYIKFSY
jgi:iron complex outermembrane receptor protein